MSNDKLQKWALIAEIIGGLAIVISLVFVGFEIRHSAEETRQAAKITRAATSLQLKQDWVELNLTAASSPELAKVQAKWGMEGYESLSQDEKVLFIAYNRATWHIQSNAYYQYRLGLLEQEQWDAVVRDVNGMTHPKYKSVFWVIWDEWQHML